MEPIKIVVGFDQREAIAYHVFCQSVLEKASQPVCFLPLALNSLAGYQETHRDGSNTFIYSRFLTPYLNRFSDWAIFADGDMVCTDDVRHLWKLRDDSKAALVAKHEYRSKTSIKYLGNKNENYPRKNWSSVILWNCAHPKNRVLTPAFVAAQTGAFLHRFSWLEDTDIGELPREWNWLTTEYDDNYEAKLLHYTLGTPCFRDYADAPMADVWHRHYRRVNEGMDV